MQSGPILGVEKLNGGDEGCGVGTKVGKEESASIHHDEKPLGNVHDLVIGSSKDDQERGHNEEACSTTQRPCVSVGSKRGVFKRFGWKKCTGVGHVCVIAPR